MSVERVIFLSGLALFFSGCTQGQLKQSSSDVARAVVVGLADLAVDSAIGRPSEVERAQQACRKLNPQANCNEATVRIERARADAGRAQRRAAEERARARAQKAYFAATFNPQVEAASCSEAVDCQSEPAQAWVMLAGKPALLDEIERDLADKLAPEPAAGP
ncbi:MAG: hypothetical protein AAF610_11870 [Pseudomonadota bacterium]